MRTSTAIRLWLAAVAGLAAGSCRAACALEPQGSAHVGAIVDGRTLRLTDGREIRLAGLARPAGQASAPALSALVGDRDIALRGQDDGPDRYGRESFFVFLDGTAPSVQEALLAAGEAVYSGLLADTGCAASLLQAEAAARSSRRGVWAAPDAIKNAERAGDILALAGQFVVVEGKVVSVRQAGATFYVNFGRRWTEGFAVTISGRMIASLETAGFAPKSLENRRIRVRGWVEQHGGPRIELLRAGQIETIADR
ncbi:MAG: thermonuclease family protein [Xanthobacteraceae bacterium]|jgi:endonuclease YncB( thermonuclease family)